MYGSFSVGSVLQWWILHLTLATSVLLTVIFTLKTLFSLARSGPVIFWAGSCIELSFKMWIPALRSDALMCHGSSSQGWSLFIIIEKIFCCSMLTVWKRQFLYKLTLRWMRNSPFEQTESYYELHLLHFQLPSHISRHFPVSHRQRSQAATACCKLH